MRHKLLVVGILVALGPALRAEEKMLASPYYPLKVGTSWTYRIGEEKVFLRVARHEKVGNDLCAVIESVKDDKVIETEHVAVRGDGIYRIATDDSKLDPPMLILRVPAFNGDSWKVKFKAGEATVSGTVTIAREEVQVPAGKFQAVVTRSDDFEIDGTKLAWSTYYVRDVGIVKKVAKVGGLELVLELEKFEPAR